MPLFKRIKEATQHYQTIVGADGTVYRANENDPTDIQPAVVNGKPLKTHIPRDPSDAPPMNTHTQEQTAQELAASAVQAAQGDPIKAMSIMESSSDYPKAVAAGMTRRHYYQAAADYKAQQARALAQKKREDYLYGGDDLGASTGVAAPGMPSAPGQKPAATTPASTSTPAAPAAPRSAPKPAGKPTITQDQFEYLTTPTEQGGRGMSPADVRTKYQIQP
jgi:hypothetical protein